VDIHSVEYDLQKICDFLILSKLFQLHISPSVRIILV